MTRRIEERLNLPKYWGNKLLLFKREYLNPSNEMRDLLTEFDSDPEILWLHFGEIVTNRCLKQGIGLEMPSDNSIRLVVSDQGHRQYIQLYCHSVENTESKIKRSLRR
jgi:hypothetical protein